MLALVLYIYHSYLLQIKLEPQPKQTFPLVRITLFLLGSSKHQMLVYQCVRQLMFSWQ
jgi:hypothetical protein